MTNDKILLVRKVFLLLVLFSGFAMGETALSPDQISEVLPTRRYLEFSELDPIPGGIVQWEKNSGKFLYITKSGEAFIFLMGSLSEGHTLSLESSEVTLHHQRFEILLPIPMDTKTHTLKFVSPSGKTHLYRLVHYWLSVPPALRVRIKESGQVARPTDPSSGTAKGAHVQLYSGANPVQSIDLDSQKYAQLTFRIHLPPDADSSYDGWSFHIRNSKNTEVFQMKRFGNPLPYLPWRDVSKAIDRTDTYTYVVVLYKNQQVLTGQTGQFEALEGQGILSRPYLPTVQIEPRSEIGYFTFGNAQNLEYGNLYVGADLGFVFWHRMILRGTALVSMHNLENGNVFSFTRFGAGLRFFGTGDSRWIGKPYAFRLDVLFNHAGYVISPDATIPRYAHLSFLVEPHLLLWGYQYLVPWFELGSRPALDHQRLSLGFHYFFYIRPWSLKWGLGFATDRLFRFDPDPSMEFTVYRMMVSFVFDL